VENPPPEDDVVDVYGGESYYCNPDFGRPETGGYHGYKDYLADRGHIEAKFGDVLASIECWKKPGRLLDVGAGPGFLVSTAVRRGWHATGVDPNPWAVRYGRSELGLDLRQGTLEQAEFEDAYFDAVAMMDVIEHVPDPGGLLGEAARITRPGGVLALITPDSGSPVSRALGARWPEVQRVPEHLVLFSVRGLAALLNKSGYEVLGWHSIGKSSSLATLLADVSPVAPGVGRRFREAIAGTSAGDYVFELDPRTKFCLYALRTTTPEGRPGNGQLARRPYFPRLPKRTRVPVDPEGAMWSDLHALAKSRRLSDWMFEHFADIASGRIVEVGAGIGTFSTRLLERGVQNLLLLEPDRASAEVLETRFAGDPRVRVAREELPGAASLSEAGPAHDSVVCQNVLEHVDDDRGALAEMASALRPGGRLSLLVPAHPRLFGSLDLAYGHYRRYTRRLLAARVREAGLEIVDIYSFNLLGVLGWWVKNRRRSTGLGRLSLMAYDGLLALWRPLETRFRPRWGLSLIVHARKPTATPQSSGS